MFRAASLLRALPLGVRFQSSRAPSQLDRIARFTDLSGDEFFGVFTDASESRARVASRGEDGRLSIGTEEREVDVILPPLEPPAVYCIGRASGAACAPRTVDPSHLL